MNTSDKVTDRGQLIRLVEQIRAGEGTEDDVHERLMLVRRSVPDPYVSDYVFAGSDDMTAEEVVDRALAYKPIQL